MHSPTVGPGSYQRAGRTDSDDGEETLSVDVDRPQLVTQEDPSCLTFDRQLGTCRSIRDCYRYTRLHQSIKEDETWVIGTRGSCSFTEPSGKQVRRFSVQFNVNF